MPSRSVRTAAVAAALSALLGTTLAGCGGDSAGAGASSAASSTPTASSSSAVASSSATTSTAASPTSTKLGPGLPGVPADARANTEAAAIAFVKHYFTQINATGRQPRTGVLEPYGLPGCKSCTAYAGNVQGLVKKKQHNSGDAAIVHHVNRIAGEAGMVIRAEFDQAAIDVVENGGNVSYRYPLVKNAAGVFFLTWGGQGWRIAKIQSDKSGVGS
ncbi:hypothetical protein [Luteipulveratus halotolerans]|uniref:Lipoprotein n=1 Tax=Luteipulveratus halotolerans TaxID=1631356 RepID=A0A0L6CMA6_9MICO|nr:hypothetical protein [Luteipulveratus halotolerans]KNX38864.1 hypothetical protein VV01_19770 [Luteipulveratus halotolerans]